MRQDGRPILIRLRRKGLPASLEDGENVFLANVVTNNKTIKKGMADRAGFRRGRRRHHRIAKQRKAFRDGTQMKKGDKDIVRSKRACLSRQVTYPGAKKPVTHKVIIGKEAKFNNRRREEGWLTPSARQVIQTTLGEIRWIGSFLPISHLCIERNAFDFRRMENEDIKAWEYCRGPLYGFRSYRDYIWESQRGVCLLCGKNPIEEYHHILPQKDGKYDHVGNIAGLCKACHHGPDGVHQRKEAEDQLKEIKEGVRQKYKVGLLNSAMPRLLDEARDFCEERGIVFTITDGKATAEARSKFSLKKDHCLDAYAISLADREIWKGDVTVADVVYERRRFKKASKNMISARNQRVYSLGGKAVAYNRHKATDQQEDSLEEFLEAFKKGHSEPRCRQLIHRLEISPAKRTYTYHKKGLKPPVRPGDVVLYEKKNKVKGNTKRWVFVASSVMYAQSVVSRKGEKSAIREWKVEGAQGGTRKAKFCRPLRSGCVQVVRTRPVSM